MLLDSFTERTMDEALITCVFEGLHPRFLQFLKRHVVNFRIFGIRVLMGVIVHVWLERQVTVWLADLMSMTRRRRKPTYLCFLYFEDSTVQKIMGQSGGSFLSRIRGSFLSRILLEERILQPPGCSCALGGHTHRFVSEA